VIFYFSSTLARVCGLALCGGVLVPELGEKIRGIKVICPNKLDKKPGKISPYQFNKNDSHSLVLYPLSPLPPSIKFYKPKKC
jgi:hypothetical protein